VIRRGLIIAQACGGPLFVALLHLNIVKLIGPILRRTFDAVPLHPLTARVYDAPLLATVPLALCSVINACVLFRAWRRSPDAVRASRLEANACLASGVATLVWVIGILYSTVIAFIITIQGVRPGDGP
jgi:hypothetical protein